MRTKPKAPGPTLLAPTEWAALVTAADALGEALGVTLSATRLAEGLDNKREVARVTALSRKLAREPGPGEPQEPSPDERAEAEALADALEKLPTSSERIRRAQALVAALARRIGHVPSAAEQLVFRGAPAGATLDDFADRLAAVAPAWRGRRNVNWAALEAGEPAELERLVEKALGEPDYFRKRRGEAAGHLRLQLLGRRAEDGAPRRQPLPEGSAWLPVGLLDDVHRGALEPVDLAVVAAFALTLTARQVDPRRERDARFDGDAIVVGDDGRKLLADWDAGADLRFRFLSSKVAGSLRRLAAARWLAVEPEGRAVRVRLGERFSAGRGGS